MAGGTRSDLTSSSPEGSTFTTSYPNGLRGSYSGPSMERSVTFRENLDNRVSSSGSGVPRSLGSEVPPLTNSLMLEPLSLYDQKPMRYGELKRIFSVSLGEPSSGSLQSKPLPPLLFEELKHFKASVQESSVRARDRVKMLHESIGKLDKSRNVLPRKRSRNESSSSEKSTGSLKMGSQIPPNPSDSLVRVDERTKNTVPNKRIRSSMVEVRMEGRTNALLRQGTVIDKDKGTMGREKNMLRACNGGINLAEEKIRGLPPGGDGWEKNMKRKRSAGASVSRMVDSDRELKQGMQPRLKNESRVRGCESNAFRLGSSNGTNGTNKLDGSSQQNFGNSCTLAKSVDNVTLTNDQREHSLPFDKERSVAKGANKLSIREESLLGSQSPLTKKASRTPRTAAASATTSSPTLRASGALEGWEQIPSLNKGQPSGATSNRKRSLAIGSSAPHVAQWVGQRPLKSSRTRRTNLVSPVSGNDESQTLMEGSPASESGARLASIDTNAPLTKGMSDNAHLLDVKPANTPSPSILSESEESSFTENKYKDKAINKGEEGSLPAVRKASTVLLPTKKNKISREETVDGVRRLGRSGRGSVHVKSGLSLKDKLENIQTTKSMRTGRPATDRSESKDGRPLKKITDRKTFTRPGNAINTTPSELAECDNDHDELISAAQHAQNSSDHTCSNLFWKTVDPLFSFVTSDRKIAWLKEQISSVEKLEKGLEFDAENQFEPVHPVLASQERKENPSNDACLNKVSEALYHVDKVTRQADASKFETDDWLQRIIPLSQRLVAAIIPEFGNDVKDSQKDFFSQFLLEDLHDTSGCATYGGKNDQNRAEIEYEPGMTFQAQESCSRDYYYCNGDVAHNDFRRPSVNNHSYNKSLAQENIFQHRSDTRVHPEYFQNGVVRKQNCDHSPSVFEYGQLSLDEKILLELQSIGLQPEVVPDLADGEDEIDKHISELKMKLHQQVKFKRNELLKLEKALQNAQLPEERNLEQLAMNKLTEIAYKKLMGGRGSHSSNSKGGVNKVPKQAALNFAKRALLRCQKFESGEKSCFSEPPFRSILFSAPTSSHSPISVPARAVPGAVSCQPLGPCSSTAEEHGMINAKHEKNSGASFQCVPHMRDQSVTKHETVPRGKKREVLLDDVGNAVSKAASTLGNSIPGGAKGKRSERERDQNKDSSRSNVAKVGRPSTGSSKSERKAKTKLKQKTAQLSTSGVVRGRKTETGAMLPLAQETCDKTGLQYAGTNSQDLPKEAERADSLSNLVLNAVDPIEDLGANDELGGVQDQDLGSWLNVDDVYLPDNDLMGLEIPMDDLTELNIF